MAIRLPLKQVTEIRDRLLNSRDAAKQQTQPLWTEGAVDTILTLCNFRPKLFSGVPWGSALLIHTFIASEPQAMNFHHRPVFDQRRPFDQVNAKEVLATSGGGTVGVVNFLPVYIYSTSNLHLHVTCTCGNKEFDAMCITKSWSPDLQFRNFLLSVIENIFFLYCSNNLKCWWHLHM